MEYSSQSKDFTTIMPGWTRVEKVHHETFRTEWVREKIRKHRGERLKVLDVGCGTQPFREYILENGFTYVSHDFLQYDNDTHQEFGLHNSESPQERVDIVCDILDIPEENKYDIVLCTEVFEHLPDPVKALDKLAQLVKRKGTIILTFPSLSWTHQAPYYFSAGLSPYWLNYHSKNVGLYLSEGLAIGSMQDLITLCMHQYESYRSKALVKFVGILYRFALNFVRKEKVKAHYSVILQVCAVLEKK